MFSRRGIRTIVLTQYPCLRPTDTYNTRSWGVLLGSHVHGLWNNLRPDPGLAFHLNALRRHTCEAFGCVRKSPWQYNMACMCVWVCCRPVGISMCDAFTILPKTERASKQRTFIWIYTFQQQQQGTWTQSALWWPLCRICSHDGPYSLPGPTKRLNHMLSRVKKKTIKRKILIWCIAEAKTSRLSCTTPKQDKQK